MSGDVRRTYTQWKNEEILPLQTAVDKKKNYV